MGSGVGSGEDSVRVAAFPSRSASGRCMHAVKPGYGTSMLPADTHPEAHRVQVDVWRRMGPEGRSRTAVALSESLYATARAQIVAKRPDWTPREITLALIRRVHGAELAQRANGGVEVPEP